jgi:hypothetical protein
MKPDNVGDWFGRLAAGCWLGLADHEPFAAHDDMPLAEDVAEGAREDGVSEGTGAVMGNGSAIAWSGPTTVSVAGAGAALRTRTTGATC